jgi:hypothetical protein
MLWIGIIIGIFLGANIGLIVIAMCISSKKADKLNEAIVDDRLSTQHARGLG